MASYLQQDWHELRSQIGVTVQVDPDDPLDVVECYAKERGHAVERSLQLRSGMALSILDAPLLYESSTKATEEAYHGVELHFHIQGHHDDGLTQVGDREFCIRGGGVHPKHRLYAVEQRALEVSLWLEEAVLRSMFADGAGELPQELADWLRSESELRYA